jgi:hypothetical protein
MLRARCGRNKKAKPCCASHAVLLILKMRVPVWTSAQSDVLQERSKRCYFLFLVKGVIFYFWYKVVFFILGKSWYFLFLVKGGIF